MNSTWEGGGIGRKPGKAAGACLSSKLVKELEVSIPVN